MVQSIAASAPRWRTNSESARLAFVDEGRKRVLLIAASILAARKLAQPEPGRTPAFESVIANAITTAERIMARIDARWPTGMGTNGSRFLYILL